MRIKIFLIFALLLASVAACALSSNFTDLTTEEVNKRIDQPGKVLIVDTRPEKEYRQGHIPNAINIPSSQFKSIRNLLPQDKVMPIIFYCRGYS
ncbi:MAG: rhodanese-like domain-containing protein [Desulfobulbaceae bacterium]|jgi:rhodanese-related sulfurtransferase|nr:rhodanese-like domain-containing protein [Desulfobulbaceae bacterium]MDH3783659.1 rhodanese-like domain-containing protein [Desulfobulbaceae bacterium]